MSQGGLHGEVPGSSGMNPGLFLMKRAGGDSGTAPRSDPYLLVDPRSPVNAGTPGTVPTGILTHGDGRQRQAARVPAFDMGR